MSVLLVPVSKSQAPPRGWCFPRNVTRRRDLGQFFIAVVNLAHAFARRVIDQAEARTIRDYLV